MPSLPRAPRPARTGIDTQIRHAILIKGRWLGIRPEEILELYRDDECYPSVVGLMEALAERYELDLDKLVEQYSSVSLLSQEYQDAHAHGHGSTGGVIGDLARSNPKLLLAMLPDAEFLTALEVAAFELSRPTRIDNRREAVHEWLSYVDKALRKNGLSYRLKPGTMNFEWIGDPALNEIVLQPALAVLGDQRLGGVRAEFDEALRKRRQGAPKDLEDAVDEAAKSVESILKVLHDEHGVPGPRSEQISSLFNSLVTATVLPGYVDKLVAAAAGPRNHMASHGQGATVREVPEELADASIGAAATAITLLAHYLP